MNRSGSTFLAKELDRLEAVRATLEVNFPFDEAPGQALSSSEQVEGYLDALFANRKFGAWQLSRAAVTVVLESAMFPLGLKVLWRNPAFSVLSRTGGSRVVPEEFSTGSAGGDRCRSQSRT